MANENSFGAPDLNPMITGAEGRGTVGGARRALVLSDTDNLLGRPIEYPSNDVFKQLGPDGATERNLQFPIQLGDDDVQNFMLFKMYNGHSEQYYKLERQVQEIESLIETQESFNLEQEDGGLASAQFQKNLVDGIMLSSGQVVQMDENDTIWVSPINGPDTGYSVEGLETELKLRQKQLNKIEDEELVNAWWSGGKIKESPKTVTQVNSQRMRKANIRQKETIALYMPHKLNVANFNTYEAPDFKLLNEIKGIVSLDTEAIAPILRRKLANVADSAVAILGADLNLKSAIAAAEGRVENPRKETLYQSPELRKFEFSFEFAPRNQDESKQLFEIIKTFKHHAYPSIAGGGYFFNMPSEFELQFYSVIDETAYENVWLNRIGRCVLQEINIDYTAAGVVSFFNNGAPTNINMTLTFQEVELITQDKIDMGY
jgi:hypothetical protein